MMPLCFIACPTSPSESPKAGNAIQDSQAAEQAQSPDSGTERDKNEGMCNKQ